MRRAYGFLLLSLSGLGGAVAYTGQDAPLAEQQFKNIQSFKGEKASDVIPAMEFISASLKTNCDFCHTADRSSDEKRPKNTAREMIAMQRDINKRHFNGRNQVTCATCHGGHIHPVALPPVEGIEIRPQRSADVVPDQVLAAYGKAVGADMGKSISGLRLEGTTMTAGQKSKVDASYSGGKFVYVVHGPKADNKTGFNGTMAWFTTEKGIQAVPVVFAQQYVDQRDLFMGPDTLPKLTNLSGGTAKIDGKDNLVVTGAEADKTRVSLYFDKATGLMTRAMFSYPSILGSMAKVNDFSNYRKVNGVQLPMKITNHATEGDTTFEFRSARVDTKIDPATFDPPKS